MKCAVRTCKHNEDGICMVNYFDMSQLIAVDQSRGFYCKEFEIKKTFVEKVEMV